MNDPDQRPVDRQVIDEAPPLLCFRDPKTGDAIYPEMEKDGKGRWIVSNPELIAGLVPG
jgi:hypothetical protein